MWSSHLSQKQSERVLLALAQSHCYWPRSDSFCQMPPINKVKCFLCVHEHKIVNLLRFIKWSAPHLKKKKKTGMFGRFSWSLFQLFAASVSFSSLDIRSYFCSTLHKNTYKQMQRVCTWITEMTWCIDINERRQACRGQGGWVLKQENMVSKDGSLLGQLPSADLLRARTVLWMFCSYSFRENWASEYQRWKSQSSYYADTEAAFKSPAQSTEIPPAQEEVNVHFPWVSTGIALS